jgi:hypothetical protein
LPELCRYVVLKPVRAKTTRKPGTYPWSNYRTTAGLAPTLAFLTVDWLLSQFGHQRPAAQQKYQAFVAEGLGRNSPWEHVQGQVLLGSERFVERLLPELRDKRPFKEISREQRFAARPRLSRLVGARTAADHTRRHEATRRAHQEHGYSLSEIGRVVGLHYSTIRRIVNVQKDKGEHNKI